MCIVQYTGYACGFTAKTAVPSTGGTSVNALSQQLCSESFARGSWLPSLVRPVACLLWAAAPLRGSRSQSLGCSKFASRSMHNPQQLWHSAGTTLCSQAQIKITSSYPNTRDCRKGKAQLHAVCTQSRNIVEDMRTNQMPEVHV